MTQREMEFYFASIHSIPSQGDFTNAKMEHSSLMLSVNLRKGNALHLLSDMASYT